MIAEQPLKTPKPSSLGYLGARHNADQSDPIGSEMLAVKLFKN